MDVVHSTMGVLQPCVEGLKKCEREAGRGQEREREGGMGERGEIA